MSKRTRYFLVGSVATLVFGLSIGLVAYYNGGLHGLARNSAPDELQYVPGDAVVVAYANVNQIMQSDLRKRLTALGASKDEHGRQEFKDETGIDLERDVDSVIAFVTPSKGDEGPVGGGAVIVNGRFDVNRIETLVTSKGGRAADYRGKKVISFSGNEERLHGNGALAFLAGNRVVVGSEVGVRRAVDLATGQGSTIRTNEKMEKLIGDVSSKGNAWVVGRFDALTSQAKLPEEVTSRIPPISWFAASGEIDGGVAADLTVETTDEAAAKNLEMVMQGLRGLAGLQAGKHAAEMQQALQSFSVSSTGNQLRVSFHLPSELLYGLTAQGRKTGDAK